MTAWDIAVIGGGIAGSTAATLLAQHGLRVILLEKGTFPRQKVCGEFLSPEGAEVLRRLGIWPWIEPHHPPRIHGFTLTAGRREARRQLPQPGWGLSRWVLDHTLWQHAARSGVTTMEHCTVAQVAGDPRRGFSLTLRQVGQSSTCIHAYAVLCAVGRQGQLRGGRKISYDGRRTRFVGLKGHFRGMPLGGQVELHTISHGYCGLVEVTGGVTNLCCWVEAKALRRAGGTPERLLTVALRENSRLRARLQTARRVDPHWTTTSFAYERTGLPVEAGIWNVGDRAAMVAPLTGDGMGMGLRAAELAATIELAMFRRELPWDQAADEYARRWRREFLPRLRWGRCLEVMLLRPRLAMLSCCALSCIPSLVDELYRRTRQLIPVVKSSSEGR
jgi:flavin-dependent dehydrogenase